MEKTLSIIIPAYNVGKYIKKAISSAINQNGILTEVIVVDDGSTDNLKSIVEETFGDNDSVKYFWQENMGLYGARIQGIKHSSSKYITFIDADDYIEDNFYPPLLERMEKEGIDILEFGNYRVSEKGEILSHTEFYEEYKDKDLAVKKIINKSNCMCSVCNKIYRRELFNTSSLEKYKTRKYEEDTLTNLIAFEDAKKILTVGDIGYYYLVREGSITTGRISFKQEEYLASWECIYRRYKDVPNNKVIALGYCSRIAYAYCNARKEHYDKEDTKTLAELFKTIYKKHELSKYRFEYESFNRRNMVRLFNISPTICYLLFFFRSILLSSR